MASAILERPDLKTRLKNFIPTVEWPLVKELIDEINRLKTEKGALVLAHNYMTPDIFHGIADIMGDSLALAREAVGLKNDIIIVCGVHFMAETVKILNPDKTVLIADLEAGCSLAESITASDVRLLRKKYPGVPIVTYVNTSAAVKAESDICCTSGNALAIVEALESDTVLMIPDKYLAANIAKQTKKKILTWEGSCMVHEKFTPEEIGRLREQYPGATVIAHPECPVPVVEACDFSGSTAQMINFVRKEKPAKVLLVTECSMSDNVAVQFPDTEFVRPCNLCPHMKKITLPKILNTLRTLSPEVVVDEKDIPRARQAIERMLAVK